jgi:hypothetical protein
VLIALLLLVSSAFLTLPALIGVKTLVLAPSLVSLPSLFGAFVLLVSSASIAIFLQLAVLSLARWQARRPASPSSAEPVPSVVAVPVAPAGGAGKRLVPFLLAALALLPGCTQAPAAQAAAPAACGSAAPGQVVANAALQDGKASPAPHRVSVPLGSQVRLGVSADTSAQIHVHGYDLEYQVQPGQPMCVVFVASQAGLFDVEAHPDTLLLQLEVK